MGERETVGWDAALVRLRAERDAAVAALRECVGLDDEWHVEPIHDPTHCAAVFNKARVVLAQIKSTSGEQ